MRILIRPRATTPARDTVTIAPSRLVLKARPLRVLDFDIENRPLSYLGSDFTTAEVTAIAWAWADRPQDVTVYLLGEHALSDILTSFVDAYRHADLVTGHFIRGHDLPMVNGALMELGMAPLSDCWSQDTKLDLARIKGVSLSQESIGAMAKCEAQKEQMNQSKWRAANRLTPEGLAEVRRRVTGDVRQHLEMRRWLLERGWLGPAVLWRSGSAKSEAYTP